MPEIQNSLDSFNNIQGRGKQRINKLNRSEKAKQRLSKLNKRIHPE